MTSDRFENTMHDWLTDRAGGRAPDRLHANAMAVIGARRQRVGWWARLRTGAIGAPTIGGLQAGTAARVFAVLVLTLLVGLALGFAVGSRPAVLPTPTQSPEPTPPPWTLSDPVLTTNFTEPFSYRLPSADEFHLVMEERDIAGFGYGTGPLTGPDAELATADYGYFMSKSSRGIAVFLVSPQRARGAADFLEQVLGQDVATLPITQTTFDGRQALTASFNSCRDTCSDGVHYQGLPSSQSKHIATAVASRMIAFEVGDQTIVVDIWAKDDAEMDAWLPKATQFVESIHFDEPPPPATASPLPTFVSTSQFVEPFEYSIPSSHPQWATDAPEMYAFVDSREGIAPPGGYGPVQATSPRGIAVIAIDQLWIQACDGSGFMRQSTPVTAPAFLENLATVHGLSLGPVTSYQVDGQPALSARTLAGSACTPDLGFEETDAFDQRFVATSLPSQFFVVEIADRTVLIDVWAQTDTALYEWLPIAQEFVDSIHFIEQP